MNEYVLSPEDQRRKIMAQILSSQGQSMQATEPYGAIAKVGSQLLGAYLQGKTTESEQKVEQKRSDAYSKYIQGGGSLDEIAKFDPESAFKMKMREEDRDLRQSERAEDRAFQREMRTIGGGSDSPSSVREYEYFKGLAPEEQQRYLSMKRSATTFDLGGERAVYDPLSGGISQRFGKSLAPSQTPEARAAQKEAEIYGKERGEARSTLESMSSKLPSLYDAVSELSQIGKVATYTRTGKFVDTAKRELGLDVGEGAVARAKYISMVDNQILPLLRDTFGAQFTENEGKSLRATLGSPDLSPEEKDAVLSSFITQKEQDIKNLQRRLQGATNTPAVSGGGIQFLGFE